MMRIPFSYIWRSLWARRLTTALTIGGVALVVFVFAGVLMLARGLEATLVETGSPDNVIVLRRSATSELSSQVDRATADVLEADAGVARGAEGRALLSREVVLVIDLYKKKSNALGNVSIRGVSPRALELRPGVHIVQGRPFQFGTHEVVVGKGIATLFKGVALGAELAFGGDRWTVVGIADAGGTAFDSEIWGDVDQFMQAFGRPVYSSVTFRLAQPGGFDQLKARLQADPRMQYVELKHERDYYQEQSKTLATFIRTLGIVVTTIFSFGAMIGAMITMYAAVANRTVEVGTLRALGFRRRSVLGAFLVESVVLALVGGALGVALAALLSFERISVVNFQSFSEIGFGFALSPGVIVRALVFAGVMGVVGGFLPAARAARRREEAADHAHHPGEHQGAHDHAGREREPEPDLRETLEVDDRNALEGQQRGQRDPEGTADEREHHGFDQERSQDAPSPEPEGSEGAHFDRTVRDRRVHRDHRADHGPEAEDRGHDDSESPDEHGERLRLFLVVIPLVFELNVLHAGVGLESGFELVEAAGLGEAEGQGRIHRASERLHELVGVTPDLRVEGRAARVSDADHGPAIATEGELGPEGHALEERRDALPHHHFVRAELEGPSLDDMDPGPELQCPGRHAPNRHVPERVALLLVEVDDKDHFARQDRATFGPTRHATLGFEHVRRGPVYLTRELGRGRAPEHDQVVRRARL